MARDRLQASFALLPCLLLVPADDRELAKALERFRTGDAAATGAIVAAGEAAVPGLVEILEDSSLDGRIRFQAANVLGDIGSKKGVEPLLEALKDPFFNVRRCAALALGKIGDLRAKEPLEALAGGDPFAWQDPETGETRYLVREDARAALDLLAGRRPSRATGLEREAEIFLEDGSKPPPSPVEIPVKRLPWPFPGDMADQNLFNNYQQPTDDYVHAGLDLLQTAGTEVRAVDGGFVAGIATNYPDWETHHFFVVTPTEGGEEGWSYTHLDPDTYTFEVGDRIRRGEVLGKTVDFYVGKNKGVDHLHRNYVSFRRTPEGAIDPESLVSLVDPLLFFDAKDDSPPRIAERFRFVKEGTLEEFPAGADGIPAVSGAVDVVVAIADGPSRDAGCNWGVPIVTLEIRGEKAKPVRKLVLDQRGTIAEPRACPALYLKHGESQPWLEGLPPYPVPHLLKVTNTDGDGAIEAADELHTWDTAERDAAGKPRFPNGLYRVTVRAWDLAGHRAERTATVRVANP
jgi:murein DD-endopeptidase MepM/ murein hydrolase activator NlpD